MKIRKSLNDDLKKIQDKAAQGKMRSLTLQFEEEDIKQLKSQASLKGVSMSAIVRKLFKEHLYNE